MAPYYATWMHSSHSRDATCNDCHVPHENIVKKWAFKGMDGMKHEMCIRDRVLTANYNRNATTNVDTARYEYNWLGEKHPLNLSLIHICTGNFLHAFLKSNPTVMFFILR